MLLSRSQSFGDVGPLESVCVPSTQRRPGMAWWWSKKKRSLATEYKYAADYFDALLSRLDAVERKYGRNGIDPDGARPETRSRSGDRARDRRVRGSRPWPF